MRINNSVQLRFCARLARKRQALRKAAYRWASVSLNVKKREILKEAGNYTIALTQTQGKTAGEPLIGIVVKGGKNPGGKMMTVTTNEKGEAQLKDLEKGDYTFEVLSPNVKTKTDKLNKKQLKKSAPKDIYSGKPLN